MNNTENNLIMGVAKGYCFNDIKPFVLSLRNSGYNGHLVLFVTDIMPDISNIADKYNIELIQYKEEYPYITHNQNNIIPDTFDKTLHLVAYRFIIYYLYLLEHKDKFSNILLADLRDIVFQKDRSSSSASLIVLITFLFCFKSGKFIFISFRIIGLCPEQLRRAVLLFPLCG